MPVGYIIYRDFLKNDPKFYNHRNHEASNISFLSKPPLGLDKSYVILSFNYRYEKHPRELSQANLNY